MAEERIQRRLAAILAADVVGYSRLMEADEAGTLTTLKARRKDVLDPLVAKHKGRVFKTTGDGVLVEFASAVNAVQCAVDLQLGMLAANGDRSADRQIVLRIGVNLGDVMVEGSDLYGDSVNIAARLEAIADPGGILVSGTAYHHVKNKIKVGFDDLGTQSFKNIAEPIRVHRVIGTPAVTVVASKSVADKPSVAVLNFANMSGSPEQQYFADGITEDIITELSRFRSLSVIARNSSSQYHDKATDVRRIARELGVQYIVEGSVRKAGDRLRITAQLIEAVTGNHLWAERYDRELADLFELQDELTRAIVATISGRLESAVVEGIKRKPPTDLNAYDCVMRAKLHHHRGSSEDNAEALQLLDKAIALDPGFASAYAWKVCVMGQAWTRGYRPFSAEEYAIGLDLINKGYSADENDLECVRILCEYYLEKKQFDEADRYNEKAFRLNPNDPRIVAQRSEILTWLGKPIEGLDWIERAIRLDPFGADDWAHLLGYALFGAGRYEEALRAFRRVPRPRYNHYAYMAASAAHAGLQEPAHALAAEVMKLNEAFSGKRFVEGLFYREEADNRHLAEGLQKAGLPA